MLTMAIRSKFFGSSLVRNILLICSPDDTKVYGSRGLRCWKL